MSKRRTSTDSSLPLFDLPLHTEEDQEEPRLEEAGPLASPVHPPEPRAPEMPRAPAPTKRRSASSAPALSASPAEQPFLFSPDEMAGPEDISSIGQGLSDEKTPVQDRLLGGLADLVLLATTIGLMVIGAQLIGVRVTLASWPPFVLFGLLLSFPYAVIPLAFWGRTPGMAWVGHVARTLADEPLTFGQTARRWLASVLTVALAGLPLLIAFTGRSLADRLSDSRTSQRS